MKHREVAQLQSALWKHGSAEPSKALLERQLEAGKHSARQEPARGHWYDTYAGELTISL